MTFRPKPLRWYCGNIRTNRPASRSGLITAGVRLSPIFSYFSMSDSDPQATFDYTARMLSRYGLAYLHIVELGDCPFDFLELKHRFGGPYIANGGYSAERAATAISRSEADLVAFGTPFLANPDLVERFKRGQPLNSPDAATFYQGDERGYTDYPTLAETQDQSQ